MNEFQLQTAIQMYNGYLSLHPANEPLKRLSRRFITTVDQYEHAVYDTSDVIYMNPEDNDNGDFELHSTNISNLEEVL